tara:strand:+ start:20128 stop:21354 length:1227 start_codon:yes stop_codon:yes gene_type:complete
MADNAIQQANDEFADAWSFLKAATGIPSSVKCYLGNSFKGAKTDSKNVEFSDSFMQKCISENYHGYPANHIARIAGTVFVIGHEIGHLTTHPGRGCDWQKEVKSYPCSPSQRGMWSNVLSDIVVNFNVTRSLNWKRVPDQKLEALYRKAMAEGRMWEVLTRQCGVGPSRDEHLTRHNDLRVRGKIVDNRWAPPGGNPGELEGLDKVTGKPTTVTPLYQTVQGNGLGTQFYPPIGFALGSGLDPKKWAKVRVKKSITAYQDSNTKEIYCFPNSTASPMGGTGSRLGTLTPGDYVVEKVTHYGGQVNTTDAALPRYYQIQGVNYPVQYFDSLCPDCGLVITNQFVGAYQPSQNVPAGDPARDHNFMYRMLLTQEFAGNAATAGYGRLKGKDAARQWIADIAYPNHVAYKE